MQRKYNMALQHFYQAATNTNDEQDALKIRLKDLSGSEEDLYISERYKQECFEMKDMNDGVEHDYNDNNFLKFKKELEVKRIKPEGICSKKGCILLTSWFIIFIMCLMGLTYFLQLAINNIDSSDDNYVSNHQTPISFERFNETASNINDNLLKSCSSFSVNEIWHKKFADFQTESAIRMIDVNNDGINDIVMGFVTNQDGPHKIGEGREKCKKNFKGQFPCFGGVIASEGRTGKQLWIHYSNHEIYAINCNGDLDMDGIADCLSAGRDGVFEAISGKTGKLIWMFLAKEHLNEDMNLYTPQFIYDVDFDGVMDVLQIHGGDPFAEPFSETRLAGKILIFSGKTGLVIKSITVPDKHESYFSPIVYLMKNGTQVVIFGTGGETHGGSLYIISMKHLLKGHVNHAQVLLTNSRKGFMNPPVLVDLNGDGVVDIVNCGFSESITAIDGETFKQIWQFTLPSTETYSVAAPGYYNDDDVIDFFVRLSYGQGFPVYYHSKMIFLDGKTGIQINKELKTSSPVHSSPLSVSMEGSGNDLFIYWTSDCIGHEHEGGEYHFVNGTNIHASSRYDSCIARFDTKSFSKLSVMNRRLGFPGKEIYNSEHSSSDANRHRRHIGTPDHGGVQRIIQTGAIDLSLPNITRNEFDVLFATYYTKMSNVRAIRPTDIKCIEEYRKNALNGKVRNRVDVTANKKLGFTDEADTAINHCLSKRKQNKQKENVNEEMVLHRYRIKCVCNEKEKCAQVLPNNEQGWTEYMGTLSNGLFQQRQSARLKL